METFKNIATIVGCISGCIALLAMIFKPIRQWIINAVINKQRETESSQKLNQVIESLGKVETGIEELDKRIDKLDVRGDKMEKNILDNEAQRLKSELFVCGNRCRRGNKLYPEEFEHMRDVYNRYSNVLHQNHDGTQEWEFIYDYYNNQNLNKHN